MSDMLLGAVPDGARISENVSRFFSWLFSRSVIRERLRLEAGNET